MDALSARGRKACRRKAGTGRMRLVAVSRGLVASLALAAIVSAARGVPVSPEVAMTGEITLSGLVLPVGGIREKALAARRSGIKTMVLPQLNEPDLAELPEEVRREMTFVPVTTLEEALAVALPAAIPEALAHEGGLGGTAASAARPAHD